MYSGKLRGVDISKPTLYEMLKEILQIEKITHDGNRI